MYALSILFTLAFVLYQKHQFSDSFRLRNIKWKYYGNAMKVLFFAAPFLMQRYPAGWQDYLLAGVISILLFEMLINVIALKKNLLFIGSSSATDKLGKWKWIIMFALLLVTIFIKIKF